MAGCLGVSRGQCPRLPRPGGFSEESQQLQPCYRFFGVLSRCLWQPVPETRMCGCQALRLIHCDPAQGEQSAVACPNSLS